MPLDKPPHMKITAVEVFLLHFPVKAVRPGRERGRHPREPLAPGSRQGLDRRRRGRVGGSDADPPLDL